MSQTPVLIVGAGPSGLMLSLELSRHGISHRIIDAATDKSPYSRALVLHSRTLELLSRYDGLVEELIPLGRFNMAVRVYVNQKFVSEMDVEEFEMTDTR
jgi:2-polyprenyl-6-methoxyphenol hydroxylase-like FAD-dependent oxidoreductase